MASNGQKKKIGDNTPAGSGRPIDLDGEGERSNAETHEQNHGAKDIGQTSTTTKTTSRFGRIGAYGGTKR
ncbi:hypothetical protein CsSME_00051474 [Camellia sinensis var. sinensis]